MYRYKDELPLVSDWPALTETRNVVVVPFFISDGLHSHEDIPVMLGINTRPEGRASARPGHPEACPSDKNPHLLHGRSLFYSTAIGTDPKFADVIIEQANGFDQQVLQSAS